MLFNLVSYLVIAYSKMLLAAYPAKSTEEKYVLFRYVFSIQI